MGHLPLNWLDQHGQVKPPALLYVLFAFLGKGYLVWLVSLTWHEDRSAIVQLLYPQVDDFVLHLGLGMAGIIGFLLVIVERKREPLWTRALFLSLPWLLWLTLMAQGASWCWRVWQSNGLFAWGIGLEGLLLFWFALYLGFAKHLAAYFKTWTKEEGSDVSK